MNSTLIIVMGVSGCGKSTLASALAEELDAVFIEADDFHSAQAKARMASGKPLNDTMRLPWIKSLLTVLTTTHENHRDCVMAFSGLRKQHRDMMRGIFDQTIFIHLDLNPELIKRRLRDRKHHFMPASLLKSQIDTLETTDSEEDIVCLSENLCAQETLKHALAHVKPKSKLAQKKYQYKVF